MSKLQKDITGKKFGMLTAICWIKNEKHITKTGNEVYYNYWKFRCECDKEKILRKWRVTSDPHSIKSCGCLKKINNFKKQWKGYKSLSGTYWRIVQRNAKVRNLDFSITIENVWNKFIEQNKKCALSGVDIDFESPKKQTASLDRIDSSKGYIEGNVQWVHKEVNTMKWNLTEERFLNLVEKIYYNKIYKGNIK